MATNPVTESSKPSVQGQDIDQVSSEITEILKLEKKFTEEPDDRKQIGITIQLINKYIRAIYWVSKRDGTDPKTDPRIIRTRRLQAQFLDTQLSDIRAKPDILDDRYVSVLTPDWDSGNPTIVPDDAMFPTYKEMSDNAKLKLVLQLSKISQQLSELLAPEIDLHKDLTQNPFTKDRLKELIVARGGK